MRVENLIAATAVVVLVGSLPVGAKGPPGTGACCAGEPLHCQVGLQVVCEAGGGLYLGDGTNCGHVACECEVNLDSCESELEGCQNFPGDGGVGLPPLSYTDNGDGTATDNNTGFMWEQKVAGTGDCLDALHAVGARCDWGQATAAWIELLNNRCDADSTVDCTTNGDPDCTNVGGKCGFAGHRDWRLPDAKELQSIVDYGEVGPAIDPSFPGERPLTSYFWTATSVATDPMDAWVVNFYSGVVSNVDKTNYYYVRAVRGGP